MSEYDFPFEKLPPLGFFPLPIFQGAVNEVVRAHKVPPKLAHYCAVAAACALAQMHVDVQRPAGGKVPASLYVLLQGKSGQRKTKVDECFFDALRNPTKINRKQYEEDVEAYRVRVKIWKRKEKVLMDSLGKAYESGSNTDAIEIEIVEHGKSKPEEPKEIKLVFNDVTIASLKNKLEQSPNATLLASDGKKVLKDLLLQNDAEMNQLWSGEPIDVSRKTTTSAGSYGQEQILRHDSRCSLSRIMLDKAPAGDLERAWLFRWRHVQDVGPTIGE